MGEEYRTLSPLWITSGHDASLARPALPLGKDRRRFGPCVDGSELARTFFTSAALVGAAMCSAY